MILVPDIAVSVQARMCSWSHYFVTYDFLLSISDSRLEFVHKFAVVPRSTGQCQLTQLRVLRPAGEGSFIFTFNNTYGQKDDFTFVTMFK